MADIRHAPAPVTLAQIYQELKDFGFGDPDQDINGGDFVEYGGQLFEDIGKALAVQSCDAEKEAHYNARYAKAIRAARKALIDWMDVDDVLASMPPREFTPRKVVITIEGGNYQGYAANAPVDLHIFDVDNLKAEGKTEAQRERIFQRMTSWCKVRG